MKYHLFQKVFKKMVKIKETSFLSSKCLVSVARHCSKVPNVIKNHKPTKNGKTLPNKSMVPNVSFWISSSVFLKFNLTLCLSSSRDRIRLKKYLVGGLIKMLLIG